MFSGLSSNTRQRSSSSWIGIPNSPIVGMPGLSLRASSTAPSRMWMSRNPRR